MKVRVDLDGEFSGIIYELYKKLHEPFIID